MLNSARFQMGSILEVTVEPEMTGLLQKAELMPDIPGTTNFTIGTRHS